MDISLIIQNLLKYLGPYAHQIVFLFSFVESIAFIGSFIPGSTVVIIAGFLSAQGYLNFWQLVVYAWVGAVMGDVMSYYMGARSTKFFKPDSRFLKEEYLGAGKAFFARHGGKSVFLSRFISPLRAIVPFIAGVSKMDKKSFVIWNVLSGIMWAWAHVALGYFFGDAWKKIDAWSTRISLIILAIIVLGGALWYMRRKKNLV